MLQNVNLTKRQKILCVIVPSALILCAAAWYWMSDGWVGAGEREVSKADHAIKVKAETVIEETVFYTKCKDQVKHQAQAKDGEVGLTYQEFQSLHPEWNLETFSDARIRMSRQHDAFCAEHLKHAFIGIQGDYVAVFYGEPGKNPALKELTKIAVSALHPQAVEEIQQGLAFQSNEEMLRILEGLHGK